MSSQERCLSSDISRVGTLFCPVFNLALQAIVKPTELADNVLILSFSKYLYVFLL